jgi:hypothetical protein
MATQIETAKTQRRQLVRRDTQHISRGGGLIGVDDLLRLARAEGPSDQELLGPRSERAGAAVAKETAADDSPVRGHAEAGELPHGQK